MAVALADLIFNYGVSYGSDLPHLEHISPAQPGAQSLGVNVLLNHEADPLSPAIDQTLDLVKQGGFGYIRQLLPWEAVEPVRGQYNWQRFDILVEKAQAHGLQILLRVERPPPWSRYQVMEKLTESQKKLDSGPPDNFEDYFSFIGQVARRYQGRVKYYQIWNEPNLESEWNNRQVEPARYVELLKGAYQQIKRVDPTALVLAAPLAPTDAPSPNMNDLVYLEQMYGSGASQYFDILSVQIYGLGYSPNFRYIQPDFSRKDLKRVNFNRPAAIHEVMIQQGDGAKAVWASEYGWISVPPALASAYKQAPFWGDSVDELTQASYLREGIERVRREWPWLGVINVWFMRADPTFADVPKNFTNYFALVTPDFKLRPAYTALADYNRARSRTAYTGWHSADNSPALVQTGPKSLRFTFEGERLALSLKGSENNLLFKVKLDAQSEQTVTGASGQQIILGDNLADTAHTAEITGLEAGQIRDLLVSRTNHFAWLIALGLLVFSLGFIISGARLAWLGAAGISYLTPRLVPGLRQTALNFWPRRNWWTPGAMIGALLLYYFAPPVGLALAGAALFFPLCFIRPDWAVGLAAFTAPLFLHPRNLRPDGKLEFTLTEVIIVELAAAWLIISLVQSVRRTRALASFFPRLSSLSLPLAGLFLLATLSLLVPEPLHFKEALREYRLVIIEPLALFVLAVVFISRQGSQGVLRLLDCLVLSGLMVALVGLYQFVFHIAPAGVTAISAPNQAGQVVQVEGVTRVVSVYTHPDNLGLFLGRIIPMTGAVVLFMEGGHRRWRRWCYALALIPLLAALVVSFSRGAWIAAAVAFLAMLLAARAKRGLLAYGGLALLGLAAVPFIKIERLTSLFNIESGSSGTRLFLWQSAVAMIRDHPISGLGLDQFLYYYNPEYVNPLAWTERFTSHPHNLALDFWLRLGILGPLLITWLLFSFYRTALSRPLRLPVAGIASGDLRRALALGLLGSMVACLVHGLVDNSYFVIDLAILFCLSFAMLEVLRREAAASRVVDPINPHSYKENAA